MKIHQMVNYQVKFRINSLASPLDTLVKLLVFSSGTVKFIYVLALQFNCLLVVTFAWTGTYWYMKLGE